jgi:hypothetical protein
MTYLGIIEARDLAKTGGWGNPYEFDITLLSPYMYKQSLPFGTPSPSACSTSKKVPPVKPRTEADEHREPRPEHPNLLLCFDVRPVVPNDIWKI